MPGVLAKTHVGVTMQVNRAEKIAVELCNPVTDKLEGYARVNRLGTPTMVEQNKFLGQTVALCGAGPSLASHKIEGVTQIWAINSAAPYLEARGEQVTGALTIDQTDGMMRDWAEPVNAVHYLASTCDPELVMHLTDRGREVVFFHNHVGFSDNEHEYYSEYWPPSLMLGEGSISVARFIGLAMWMGFQRIDIYGADCAFGEGDIAHVNGETAAEAWGAPTLMEGNIDGRTWRTRPDMLMGAVDIARKAKRSEGRIRLIGDTLPVALLGHEDSYLDQIMRRLAPGELTGESDNG